MQKKNKDWWKEALGIPIIYANMVVLVVLPERAGPGAEGRQRYGARGQGHCYTGPSVQRVPGPDPYVLFGSGITWKVYDSDSGFFSVR